MIEWLEIEKFTWKKSTTSFKSIFQFPAIQFNLAFIQLWSNICAVWTMNRSETQVWLLLQHEDCIIQKLSQYLQSKVNPESIEEIHQRIEWQMHQFFLSKMFFFFNQQTDANNLATNTTYWNSDRWAFIAIQQQWLGNSAFATKKGWNDGSPTKFSDPEYTCLYLSQKSVN